MKNDHARIWFIIISFFVIIIGWYTYSTNKPTIIETAQQGKTDTHIIFSNDRADKGDNPFILKAEIIKETPSELVFKTEYFLSDSIQGDYNISIHPNMGDWSYSANTMHPGLNNEIITVSFRGEKSPTATSDKMHIYINHYDHSQNKYIGKVFDRTIEFTKHWKK